MSHVRVSSQVTVEGNMLTPWKLTNDSMEVVGKELEVVDEWKAEVDLEIEIEAEESQWSISPRLWLIYLLNLKDKKNISKNDTVTSQLLCSQSVQNLKQFRDTEPLCFATGLKYISS